MTDTNLKGLFIPIEILSDENLSIQEKLILSLTKIMPNGLSMTNNSIGELLSLSKSRISDIVSSLNSKGYIDIKMEYKGKQVIKRTISIKVAVKKIEEKVQDLKESVKNKSKEIKDFFTIKKETVGTEKVNQVAFGKSAYEKPKKKFYGGYSHGYDYENIANVDMDSLKQSKNVEESENESIDDFEKRMKSRLDNLNN